jgi:hypothetical protein
LQALEFGTLSRAAFVEALARTAEYQNVFDSHNAYKAIVGEWPLPLDFALALQAQNPAVDNSSGSPTTDDVGNTIDSATHLPNDNPSFDGVLETFGDIDLFSFEVLEGSLVTIQTTGAFDTTGTLRDVEGNLIEFDDDSGEFFNFAIQIYLNPGIYYLQVAGWAGTTGSYTLTVSYDNQIDIPANSNVSNAELNTTINFLYGSDAYVNRYGSVQSMDDVNNRRALFTQLFENRFAQSPTEQQILQAQNRMLAEPTLAAFTAAFIRNDRIGLSDYIYNLPYVSSSDEAAFLIRSFLSIQPTQEQIDDLEPLNFQEKVSTLINDPAYAQRFEPPALQTTATGTGEIQPQSIRTAPAPESNHFKPKSGAFSTG